jgi:tripeptide aminopeptidase
MTESTRVLDLLIGLASINSYVGQEGKLGEYLISLLKDLGATVTVDDSAEKTGSDIGNIIATFPGDADNAPTILLCSHMDSIGPTEGMVPIQRDGIIYSNGKTVLAADDKAGIAIILVTLKELKASNCKHGDIEIVFTVQEEPGLIGAKNLNADLKSDFGYILDGDGAVGTIIHRAPAKVDLDLTLAGQAAHAGICPEEGVNAIVAASTAISRIQSGRIDKETTSNFGTIQGGQTRNIVPDHVEISAEVRSLDDEKLNREVDTILEVFSNTANEFNAQFTVQKNVSFPSFNIPDSHRAVTIAKQAAETIGIETILWASGGGLDANIFNSRGLPCVALGLGIENPHSPQEYIPAAQLDEAVRLLLAILKEAAGNS